MSNKHTANSLKQLQSLPLEAKIAMTKRRIREWYEYWDGMVYVSFSGGKDSTVLKHIVDSMYDDVPAVFVNTGLEYPEIQRFAMSQYNVVTVRPEMRFDEVLKNFGYPVISKEMALYIRQVQNPTDKNKVTQRLRLEGINSRGQKVKKGKISDKWVYLKDAPFNISEQCCDVMKKKPAKQYSKQTGRKPIIGTMASESRLRFQKWKEQGCNAFENKEPSSQPLSFWTEQDILHYLKKYNVPYCSVYGDIVPTSREEIIDGQLTIFDALDEYEGTLLRTTGCNRTGCIFCMFGAHLEADPNRFQMLQQTHPRQYEYCIGGGEMIDGKWQPTQDGLGLSKVLDYIGVKY